MSWHQAHVQLKDRLAHVLLDGRFAGTAPVAALPCLNWFGVWCREGTSEDEFIAVSEEAAISTLERQLIEVAGQCADGWAVYCMRVLSRGMVEYYLYSRDSSTLEDVSAEMLQYFPEYRIEHEAKDDASWFEYFKYHGAVL
jgi:hypothetical protein